MDDEKIVILALAKAKKGLEEKAKSTLLSLVEPTRKEAGCILYELHQDAKDSASFIFYEIWQSQKALDKHIQTPHLQGLLALADELFAKPLDVTIWKKLS